TGDNSGILRRSRPRLYGKLWSRVQDAARPVESEVARLLGTVSGLAVAHRGRRVHRDAVVEARGSQVRMRATFCGTSQSGWTSKSIRLLGAIGLSINSARDGHPPTSQDGGPRM